MPSSTAFHASMSNADAAMQAGNDDEALRRFSQAAEAAEDPFDKSEATQMKGVVLRKLGRTADAIEAGRSALELAAQSGDPDRIASCQRDLAASHHKHGLRLALMRERDDEYYREPKYSRQHFTAAHVLYVAAKHHYGSRPVLNGTASSDETVETTRQLNYAVTNGMHGMLLFDMEDHCSLSIGSKKQGARQIQRAYAVLEGSEQEVWELNTLIKLMRTSGLLVRLQLLGHGLELTDAKSASPGSRTKLLSALLGNRFCNWVEMRNLEVTDDEFKTREASLFAA